MYTSIKMYKCMSVKYLNEIVVVCNTYPSLFSCKYVYFLYIVCRIYGIWGEREFSVLFLCIQIYMLIDICGEETLAVFCLSVYYIYIMCIHM